MLLIHDDDKEKLNFNSLEEFLCSYFEQLSPKTINENGTITCLAGRRRSFSDLLQLCSYYFEYSEERVAAALIQLWKHDTIDCLYCPDISKIVFKLKSGIAATHCIHISNYPTAPDKNIYSYNKPEIKGVDGYSFDDIYELAKSQQPVN